ESMVSDKERRIALFIDFENLVTNTGISPSTFDLQPAMDRLLERGKVVFRRAYCDWSRFREATRRLHDFGVELIDVPPSTRAAKHDEGSCSPRVAAKDIRGTCRARDSADCPRGRRRPARARNGSVEPVIDQGDHRPQGARLRRAGGRILHLQQVAARDGTAGPAQAPAAE